MFSSADTIVAVSTPSGRGGIGVVRVSGHEATDVSRAILRLRGVLEPRRATVTAVLSPQNEKPVDQVVVTYFPGPASYTGEDVVEISGHGSPVMLRQIVRAAVTAGARIAEPGEFTLRAFLNERIDLVQAEAVGDIIQAVTPLQARAAFDQLEGTVSGRISEIESGVFDLVTRLEASVDFPEEGYRFVTHDAVSREVEGLIERTDLLLSDASRGRMIREGAQVVIAGKPNVGKSTLFNRLLGTRRAIVTDVAGTTRDLLTERLELNGIALTLVDTAGLRSGGDAIESEGMARARAARDVARLVIVVLDQSRPIDAEDTTLLDETRTLGRVIVVNKIDLPPRWNESDLGGTLLKADRDHVVRLTLLGDGDVDLERLRRAVSRVLLNGEELRDTPSITNLRHIELLERARGALGRAAAAAAAQSPEELVLADLAEARHALEEVTGKRTPEDVLRRIFAEFCIGK